jgi:hypothetical protein
MNRRKFLASLSGGMAGLCFLGTGSARAYDPAHRIRSQNGIRIDNRFGNTERRILNDALCHFYAKFLQPYSPRGITRWADAAYNVTGRLVDRYGRDNARHIFYAEWLKMWQHFVHSGRGFPPINLKFINEPQGYFVAQAHLDMIRINDWPSDTPYSSTGRNDGVVSRGEFDIEINDWHLANDARIGRHSSDPIYWAGVIAHEAWHNLGHGHPGPAEGGRGHPQYYVHQMVLHEMCVMQDTSIRYGTRLSRPVYCRRHPG